MAVSGTCPPIVLCAALATACAGDDGPAAGTTAAQTGGTDDDGSDAADGGSADDSAEVSGGSSADDGGLDDGGTADDTGGDPDDGGTGTGVVEVPGLPCGVDDDLAPPSVTIGGREVVVDYACDEPVGTPVTFILNLHGYMPLDATGLAMATVPALASSSAREATPPHRAARSASDRSNGAP